MGCISELLIEVEGRAQQAFAIFQPVSIPPQYNGRLLRSDRDGGVGMKLIYAQLSFSGEPPMSSGLSHLSITTTYHNRV